MNGHAPLLPRGLARQVRGQVAAAAYLPVDGVALVATLLTAGHRPVPGAPGDDGADGADGADGLRRAVSGWVGRHRARLARWSDATLPPGPRGRRATGYLAGRSVLGAVGLVVAAALVGTWVVGGQVVLAAATGGAAPLFDAGPGDVTWRAVGRLLVPALLLTFVLVQSARGMRDLELAWFRRCALDRDAVEADLRRTRLEVLEAVDAERRRIERDLHDGVQQGVVSLGMLLGQARRATDVGARQELLVTAHERSLGLLHDLRDVVWRIYPVNLDAHGLRRALQDVAESARVPVRLRYEAADHLPRPVQAAAYFTATEAVCNALKHAAPSGVEIDVRQAGGTLAVRVRDDGCGGADPGGSGLRGLRARVAAMDGTLTVSSPAGGPTVITMEIPCA